MPEIGGKWLQRARCLISVCLLYCMASTCFPVVAWAHAYVVKSNPAENQSYGAAPTTVQIWFDEPIQDVFNGLTVTDQRGNRVDDNDAHIDAHDPQLLQCSLPAGLGNGLYSVHWRVVSEDGHPVEGVIPFRVGTSPSAGSPAAATSQGYVPGVDLVLIRWALFIGISLLVGSIVFWLWIVPRAISSDARLGARFQWTIRFASLLVFVGVILSLPLQTKVDAGVSWSNALNPILVSDVLRFSTFGHIWLTEFVLSMMTFPLLAIAPTLREKRQRMVWVGTLVLGVGIILCKSETSHAAARLSPRTPIAMDFFHLLSAAIWIGSLFGMAIITSRRMAQQDDQIQDAYATVVRRFSPWGFATVGVIAATGLYAGVYQIPTWYALFHTPYGKALLTKLALFTCMLLLGLSHFIRGRMDKVHHGLAATLWSEFLFGAVVMAVAVVLSNLPTARSNPGPYEKTQSIGNGVKATLDVTPNAAGDNLITVTLKGSNGAPFTDAQQATLEITGLDMDMGNQSVRLLPVTPGTYKTRGLYLTMAERWSIRVHILTKSFQDLNGDFHVLVGSTQ